VPLLRRDVVQVIMNSIMNSSNRYDTGEPSLFKSTGGLYEDLQYASKEQDFGVGISQR